MRTLFFFMLIFSFAVSAQAGVQTKTIEYYSGGTKLKGFLAYDDSVKGQRPGILVVHEWWGHNKHARDRARMLAKLGYTALAVDMYGDGKFAEHPKKAGEFMNAAFADWKGSQAKFNAAKNLLQNHVTVDPYSIGAIGFCFGGAVSLRMAREGSDLDVVVAFHSALPLDPPVSPGRVRAVVRVINGADDPFLDPKTVETFKKQMSAATKDFKYVSLEGVKHSYTNKQADEFSDQFGIPALEYNEKADKNSWFAMQELFKRVFSR